MAYKEWCVNFCSTNARFGQKVNFVSNKQTVVGEVVIPAEAGIQSINIPVPLPQKTLNPVFRQWTDKLRHGMTIRGSVSFRPKPVRLLAEAGISLFITRS